MVKASYGGQMRNKGSLRLPELGELLPAIIPVMVVAIMLLLGWRRWPDILVDFGRELYLPWQVSSGKVLYRDIDYYFGPLSVYANAALFSVFGASFRTLFTANIIIYGAFMGFLYCFVRRLGSRLAAAVSCSVLAVFTLAQLATSGNYNFITPYSHEAIHGVMLSLLTLDQLWRYTSDSRKRHLLAGGLLAGCVLLTRVEIAIIILLVSAIFFLLLRAERTETRPAPADLLTFAAGVVLPNLLFFLYFTMAASRSVAWQFLLSPWQFVLNASITGSRYYRIVSGFADAPSNLLRMFAGALIFVLPCLVLLKLKLNNSTVAAVAWTTLTVHLAIAGWLFGDRFLFPALPLIVFMITLFILREFWQSEPHSLRRQELPLLLLAIFAFGMLGKMLLNCRVFHYGFYVTLPTLLLLTVFLVWYLPLKRETAGLGSSGLRCSMVVSIAIVTIHYFAISADLFAARSYPVALNKADLILTPEPRVDVRGLLVEKTLEWIEQNMGKDETLLVLPEGVMLNFLSRRDNPTRYFNFMLPELLHYGEGEILRDFKAHPPDVVMLVAKDSAEYGVGTFGIDPANGKQIVKWIESAYSPVILFGREPLEGKFMGVKIYRRVDAARILAPSGGHQ